MTRIIGGYAGSRRIAVPRSGTRPTSDRVREAIFSALEARDAVSGANVLDLYAGSGALGLEAVSRGAAGVVLVEKSPAAARIARENVSVITAGAPRPIPRVEVQSQAVSSYLAGVVGDFDIVFLDPPYDLDEAELTENLAALLPHLAPDAVVVIERSARSGQPGLPPGLELDRRKDYGETTLWWLYPAAPSQPA
jgi:16S rRNA (guanine966-N2)-methyltransferase